MARPRILPTWAAGAVAVCDAPWLGKCLGTINGAICRELTGKLVTSQLWSFYA